MDYDPQDETRTEILNQRLREQMDSRKNSRRVIKSSSSHHNLDHFEDDVDDIGETRVKSLPNSPSKKKKVQILSKGLKSASKMDVHDDGDDETTDWNIRHSQNQSLSQDFITENGDNIAGLRKILIRSKQKIAQAESKKSIDKDDKIQEDNATTVEEVPHVKQGLKETQVSLPNWNLSTARLRYLSRVNQIVITVLKVKLTKETCRAVLSGGEHSSTKFKNRRSRSLSTSKIGQNLSFFVSYSLPPSSQATSHCSRKMSPEDELSVVFDQKSVHPAVFKPSLLDVWWTSNLNFKVICYVIVYLNDNLLYLVMLFQISSRKFGLRDTVLLGESRIAMKHLLTSERNGSGAELRLPVFAGQRFMQENKLESEIVGDVHVSFMLQQV